MLLVILKLNTTFNVTRRWERYQAGTHGTR